MQEKRNGITLWEMAEILIANHPNQDEIKTLQEYFKTHNLDQAIQLISYGGPEFDDVRKILSELDIKMIVKIYCDVNNIK